MGFLFGSGLFEIIFVIMFIAIFGMFIMNIVRGIGEWNQNNHSPRLTVDAAVAAKRINVSHHQQANAGDETGAHGYTTSSSTTYYVTFQVESGDRMEFCVNGSEYGMLCEGDRGKLSFQGSRYLGFERMQAGGFGGV
ncbi:MAG: DUF2500 domain-containing protein [Lachnospiraceae bacterium]|nr:DUF2500 domain-containing protein [Lachnospiraceae bacterium]